MLNMTLKELRISKDITQLQASELLGVSLRSYKQYENEEEKIDTIKYRYFCDQLEKIGFVDETHGVLKFDFIKDTVCQVLKNYKVEYCYLFGSYAYGNPKEDSDVDLLVSTEITGMDFYGLAEMLRESLHKKVDLLNIEQLANNKELLNDILKGGIRLYG